MSLRIQLTVLALASFFCLSLSNPNFKQHITKDHVIEELQHQINTKDQKDMSERELQFYYFKLHDFDNNNMLDGLEIMKALRHQHDEHELVDTDGNSMEHILSDEESLGNTIDQVLIADDLSGDGYVTFAEFLAAQER